MKKRIISMMLLVVMLFSMTTVYAASDIKIIVNGEKIAMDAKPFIRNGRTFVPIRFVSEALDGEVDWDSSTKKIVIKKAGKEINIWIGLVKSVIGSIVKNDLDEAPILKDGRTFVPLRFVAQNLDCNVDWDNSTKTVIIKEKGYVEKEPVINTIDSLRLEIMNVTNYGDLFINIRTGKNQLSGYGYNKIVFIDESQLPFQVGERIIYNIEEFNDKGSLRIIQNCPESAPNDTGLQFFFVSEKDKASRLRRPYVQFTKDLGNGKRSIEYSVVGSTDIGFDANYKNYKLNQAEYILFTEGTTKTAIALKNPWR